MKNSLITVKWIVLIRGGVFLQTKGSEVPTVPTGRQNSRINSIAAISVLKNSHLTRLRHQSLVSFFHILTAGTSLFTLHDQ